jgi:cytochrome c oxidase subunit IV
MHTVVHADGEEQQQHTPDLVEQIWPNLVLYSQTPYMAYLDGA